MACPRSDHGQTLCNIVNHPDRPSETFCGTCQRRFIKREHGIESAFLLAIAAGLLFLVAVNPSNDYTSTTGENDLLPLPEDVASSSRQPEDAGLVALVPVPPMPK